MVRAKTLYARVLPKGAFDLLLQVAFMFVAYQGYRVTRGLIDDGPGAQVAFQNTRDLIDVERTLGIFVEPAVQAWAQSVPVVTDAAAWLYINAQTSVTLGALAWLYVFRNPSFYFVRNMFAVAFSLALVGYVLFPAAPPRMFPEWGFFDAVAQFTGIDGDSSVSALFNPYAAVPSMHVGFSLMIGVPLSRLVHSPVARWFWRLYPLLVVFVIVATGNHFLADAFLGACTAASAAFVARWLGRARPAAWAWAPQPREQLA